MLSVMEKHRSEAHQRFFRVEARSASDCLPVAHALRVTLEAAVLKACSCHAYLPELAPSSGLLKWYDFRAERYDEFCRRYRREMAAETLLCEALGDCAGRSRLLLLYGAGAPGKNLAEVLREHLAEAECLRRWQSGWMVGGFTYQLRDEILSRGGLWYGRHKVFVMPDAASCQHVRSLFPGDF